MTLMKNTHNVKYINLKIQLIDLFSQNYILIITPLKTAVGSVTVCLYENLCWHGTLKSPHRKEDRLK